MQNLSVKDQYCNMETGNWHETVYFGSKECHVPWYNKNNWNPFDITFTSDSCIGGLRLIFCKMGACDEKENDSSTITTTAIEDATDASVMDVAVGKNNHNHKDPHVMMSHAKWLTRVSVEQAALNMRKIHVKN
jgi:hypothetical protein